ncbi:toxin-antitoxin system, toxin component [Streptomyces sp. Tu 3180]|uniref:toxin-antitoxin system, toxin component n=1 Tax=Streptomyces sp. Tu 3180 TaxID=2682611 RepID=UPI001359E705|nr:toxin-antitoxin system, toxin component [Streptomyces sp. Tu 3180]KAF3469883.1 toxin-antitoxin system, toxin component [Streptomyces sp. Tu 3180]
MRRLCGELVAELTLPVPARPADLYAALCDAMSRRRGRPVQFRTAAFPPGTASGLWLDMADRDLVVVEERTAPDHQLVILGHELWHMKAGHCGRHVRGAEVATRLLGEDTDEEALRATVLRVAARTRFDLADEKEAEAFGLLLASKCRTWLAGSSLRGPVQRDHLAGRIEASLGYLGPQG